MEALSTLSISKKPNHSLNAKLATISIIIPTYNAEGTIAEAIDSIVAQTYPHFEIVIIDAKSDDNTLNMVNQYCHRKINIKYISERDEGIYDGMNKGIKNAKGDWLFFLGCDDKLYSNDVLQSIVSFISCNRNAKMVYGNVRLDKPMNSKNQSLIYDGFFDENKLLKKNLCHQSIFYHRSLFRRFGLFRTQYRIFADYDFNLRCFNAVKPLYFDKIIAHFNTNGQSKNNQHLDRLFEDNFLENMAVYYPYDFRHAFFTGKNKMLLPILIKHLKNFNFMSSIKTVTIIIYHVFHNRKA